MGVSFQRRFYRKGTLSLDRVTQLDGIEFNWGTPKRESNAAQWEEKFNLLVSYKDKYGNCNVAQNKGNALGNWVKRQRQRYKNGKLSLEHRKQLEDVGFLWETKRGPRKAASQGQSGLHVDSVTETYGSDCPALPHLPPEQKEV